MKRSEGKVSYQLEMSAINALLLMLMQSLKAKWLFLLEGNLIYTFYT